jgi:hypothetical protein
MMGLDQKSEQNGFSGATWPSPMMEPRSSSMNRHAGSIAVLAVVLSGALWGQDDSPKNTFSQDQLEQMVAPIALYPDALVSQMLMASTYPLEVVEADRWLDGKAGADTTSIDDGLKEQNWDPSVKALVKVPEILKRMSGNLDWTRDLGDAFLAQKEAVMAAIQSMRKRAKDAGNLGTTPEQTVTTEGTGAIMIEQADPEVIYVPEYGTAVYGDSWTYATDWYPYLWTSGKKLLAFAAARRVGYALWGRMDWRNNDVSVNVNRYNSFNQFTTRDFREREAAQAGWRHDVDHRRGIAYREPAIEQRYRSPQVDDYARGRAATPGNQRTYFPSADGARAGGGRGDGRSQNGGRAGGVDRGDFGGGFSGAAAPRADRAASDRGSYSRGDGVAARGSGGGARGGGGHRGGGGRGGGRR